MTNKKTPFISIDNRLIGAEHPPYIIAELSANHNGSIDTAFKIIDAAKKSGADAVKIQSYLPSTITLDCDKADFQITEGLWAGNTLYKLYEGAHLPWEWHGPLFDYAKKIGISIFSSPFDHTAVDLLEDLNTPAYKIASFEAIDLPLIKYVAATGKPMIISTGMANADEIAEAIDTARAGGCKELAILHCVSGYPSKAIDYNLRTIPDMIKRHGLVTGLSDHTIDNITAVTSVAMGASIIEKHVTLDRQGGGPDDSFSLEPKELTELVASAKTAWESLGIVSYDLKESEKGNKIFRRSLYAAADIKAGEFLTVENVRSVRPGFGLPPRDYDSIIGKKARVNIEFGTALNWGIIEGTKV
jgi:pseudaminic acid synthase